MKNFDSDFEVVDKKETINNFIDGNISEQFYDNYYYVEIINGGSGITNNFRSATLGQILDAVSDSNVVFLHKFATK
jgi:hypothetical protein